MNKDLKYEQAKIEILQFENREIITTSGWTDGTPLGRGDSWNSDSDGDGWI